VPLASPLDPAANTVSSMLVRTGDERTFSDSSPYLLSTLVSGIGNNIGDDAYPDNVSEGNPSIAESQATTVNNGMLGSPFSDNTSLASLQSHTSQYITQNTPKFRLGNGVKQQSFPSTVGSGGDGGSVVTAKTSGLTIDVSEQMDCAASKVLQSEPRYSHQLFNMNNAYPPQKNTIAEIPVCVGEKLRIGHIDVKKGLSASRIDVKKGLSTSSFGTDFTGSASSSNKYSASSKMESYMDSDDPISVRPGKKMTIVRRMKKTGSAVLRATRLMKPKIIHEDECYEPPAQQLSPHAQRVWERENINYE